MYTKPDLILFKSPFRLIMTSLMIAIICHSHNTIAGGSIHGQVRDRITGKPVPFALISVQNCNATNALEDGAYIIDCPAGSYSLEISANNYEKYTFDGFYLKNNQFLKKDVILSPVQSRSTQHDYVPTPGIQNYQQEEYYEDNYPQDNSQNYYGNFPENQSEQMYTQETIKSGASKSATLLGDLLGKKAGDRLEIHMQKRQQKKHQSNQNAYPSDGYNDNEYYYTDDAGNESYYPEEYNDYNTGDYYYPDSGGSDEYYTQDNIIDEYYQETDSNNNELSNNNPVIPEYQEQPNNSRKPVLPDLRPRVNVLQPGKDINNKNAGEYSDSGSSERSKSYTQPSNSRKPVRPNLKPRLKVSKSSRHTSNNKQNPRPDKSQARRPTSNSFTITNNTETHLITGGGASQLTLKGQGLGLIKSISVVNPKGQIDKSIEIKHDSKASDTQKTIYISAFSNAISGIGFYRLQLHTTNRNLIVHPDKIRLIVKSPNHPSSRNSKVKKSNRPTLR